MSVSHELIKPESRISPILPTYDTFKFKFASGHRRALLAAEVLGDQLSVCVLLSRSWV